MITFSVSFLGCKVNQVDTQDLRENLLEAGFTETPWGTPSDVAIVNSCTVTARADRQNRQLVRRARRAAPDCLVVLTGCMPSRPDPELPEEVDLVIDNDAKPFLVDRICEELAHRSVDLSRAQNGHSKAEEPDFHGRARAYAKVQDGCDGSCAYCIVPTVRGPSRSVPWVDALENVRKLAATFPEVVLTGIHLGDWGKDLSGKPDLASLCRSIEDQTDLKRLRLSSIEPGEITGELLDWMAGSAIACDHLHIPLQSGDPEILKSMNRTYTPEEYSAVIGRVVDVLPEACIGADVLAGFPGETEDHFHNTRRLIESLPVAYLHVFPYSIRPGTAASSMKGVVKGNVAKERAANLREISANKREVYARRFIGKTLEMVVETVNMNQGVRTVSGKTRNYLSASLENDSWNPGDVRLVTATSAGSGTIEAKAAEE